MHAPDTAYPASGVTTDQSQRVLRAVIIALCAKAALLLFMALNTQFVMDEFWQFGQSKYLGDGFFDTVWPAKAVGYAVFYQPAHWLGWDAVSAILIGRIQTALLAVATVALLFATARALGQNRLQALLVILLVLSFSTFMERVFRTRSESLALFFGMAALYWITSRDAARVRTVLIAGCFSGLAFLATQKAVYFNVSLGLGLTVVMFMQHGLRKFLTSGVTLVLGWSIPVAVYCLAFGGWDAQVILATLFKGPVAVATNGHSYYDDLGQFFLQTAKRNLLPYLLCAAGLAVTLFRWRSLIPAQKIAMIFTLVMIVLIARHNQPWPYVFIMVIPFLTLWAPATLEFSQNHSVWGKRVRYLWVIAIALSFARNVVYLENDNQAAINTMRQAEHLLEPGETYFDGIGMLSNFRESQRRWLDVRQIYIANTDGESSDVMQKLRKTPPHLIIDSYRTQNLGETLRPFLEESYVRIAPNILLPGLRIDDLQEAMFDVPVAAEFALFDKAGKPVQATVLVDGEAMEGSLSLDPGPVRLSLQTDASAPLFLLPAHKTYSTLHPEPAPVRMFNGVYVR